MNFIKKSIRLKLILSTFLITVIGMSLVTLGIYFSVLENVEKNMGEKLEHIAATGSLLINGEDHQAIFKNFLKNKKEQAIKSIEFKEIVKTLRDIKKINNLEQDIYTLVRPSWIKDKMIFVTMSNEKTYLGNAIDINQYVETVFEKGTSLYSKIYNDSEGSWISGFSPIKNKENKVVAILEVDYNVTHEVHAIQVSLFIKSLGWMLIGIIISIISTIYISQKLVSPIRVLTDETTREISEKWGESLTFSSDDEIGKLSESMKKMVHEILKNREELESYAKTLEQKVENRTKKLINVNSKLTAILNALGQGLFLVNKDGSIDNLYSEITKSYLNVDIDKVEFKDLFYKPFDQVKSLDVIYKNIIPYSDALELLPDDIRSVDDLFLEIKYRPIVDSDNQLSQVLAIITDKTESKLNEKIIKQKEIETNLYFYIYTREHEIRSFIIEITKLIDKMKNESNIGKFDEKSILSDAHTIKGTAATFFAVELADEMHCLEGLIISDDKHESKLDKLNDSIVKASTLLKKYVENVNQKLKYNIEDEEKIRISKSDLVNIISQAKTSEISRVFFETHVCQNIDEMFKEYDQSVKLLAKKLGKKVNNIIVNSGNINIYRESYSLFFLTLIHYFRNIVDHAIETPEERGHLGKSEFGTIIVNVKYDEDFIYIKIKDDGQGIDPVVIRKILEKNGFLNIEKNDHLVIQQIFTPKISTKKETTDISGRGIGMDAIKNIVDEMGGAIEVFSVLGKGTTLDIKLPNINFKETMLKIS